MLGFDFGQARIGVALGNTEVAIAHPLETITGDSNDQRFARIGVLIQEWSPAALVVGLPAITVIALVLCFFHRRFFDMGYPIHLWTLWLGVALAVVSLFFYAHINIRGLFKKPKTD